MCVQQHSMVCVCGRAGPFASKPLSLPTILLAQNFYFSTHPANKPLRLKTNTLHLFSSAMAGKERNAVFPSFAAYVFVV